MISESTVTFAHEVNMSHFLTAAEGSTEKVLESFREFPKEKNRGTKSIETLLNSCSAPRTAHELFLSLRGTLTAILTAF